MSRKFHLSYCRSPTSCPCSIHGKTRLPQKQSLLPKRLGTAAELPGQGSSGPISEMGKPRPDALGDFPKVIYGGKLAEPGFEPRPT